MVSCIDEMIPPFLSEYKAVHLLQGEHFLILLKQGRLKVSPGANFMIHMLENHSQVGSAGRNSHLWLALAITAEEASSWGEQTKTKSTSFRLNCITVQTHETCRFHILTKETFQVMAGCLCWA